MPSRSSGHHLTWPAGLGTFANIQTKITHSTSCRGLSTGSRSGSQTILPSTQRCRLAKEHPEVIEDYLHAQRASGNILGPFPIGTAPKVHVSRFGVIPKKHQPGKWRLITDLSNPEGNSVNDAINPDSCSLSYISVHDVARAALKLGKGALIAKIDVRSAYRLVPICAYDRRWLGMRWKDHILVDGMLPFGLRSAPNIFNAIADAIEWIVGKEGAELIFHYLDDFAVVGPPDSPECQRALDILKRICAILGVPLAPDKQDGPSAVIIFLGIIIDTIKQELRLPENKLQRLLDTIRQWEHKKSCTRQELESLLGTLHHACTVIPSGRAFVRRILSLLSIARRRHHHIRLNREMRSDLQWWKIFAAGWNGASLIIHEDSREHVLTSDASGHWGCGAWYLSKWFQLQWSERTAHLHIAAKELIPIVIAAVIWGTAWKGGRVVARCDNAAVVAVVNSRYSRDAHLMQMLRCLFFIEAHFQFQMEATHIPGTENILADDLSRGRQTSFRQKISSCDPEPSIVPPSLLQWLLHPQLDWTSPSWMELFNSFAQRE